MEVLGADFYRKGPEEAEGLNRPGTRFPFKTPKPGALGGVREGLDPGAWGFSSFADHFGEAGTV